MTAPPFTVRPVETNDEIVTFFRLCILAYWPDADQEREFDRWYHFVTDDPEFAPQHVRAVFRGTTMVGGCVVHERMLRMPPVELHTDCIALVATHPEHREQGVSRALMTHVVDTARDRGHDLLLLGGIPNLYHRFGFVDMFDDVEHLIDRSYVLAQPPSPCRVRPATLEDAATLVALYDRYHLGYTGSFPRTVAWQLHQLRSRDPNNPPLLVMQPDGTPCGYMLPGSATRPERAAEVEADSWPAALALLHYQAHLLDAHSDPPDELVWTVAPNAPTLYHLLDNMNLPRTTPLPPYPQWFVVRSLQRHLPIAGMMARPAHLGTLIQHLLPRWRERWQRSHPAWTGTLALEIGGETFYVAIGTDDLTLVDQQMGEMTTVRLSQGLFTQLLFGFRPVSWAAQRPEQTVPEHAMPVLEQLFPMGHSWFAASDAF